MTKGLASVRDVSQEVGKFGLGLWYQRPNLPPLSWNTVAVGMLLGPFDWTLESYEIALICFCAELHGQAKARAAVLLHPHQKTMASYQKISFVRCSVAVEAPFSFQRLLRPLMNGLGQEMRLPAAYLYGRPV